MRLSKTLKSAALAGILGLGLAAATTTPANADRVYTRCNSERCWKVACDWNDCRRMPVRWHGDGPSYRTDRRYYDSDRDRFYRYHHFDHRRGVWVCDGDSEYCRWSARRW
jgi:hypothetical protein